MTLSFHDAQARVFAELAGLGVEHVRLDRALGRVAAEDVIASMDVPSFASSAMDGFAVRRADVEQLPARLSVVDVAPAGRPALRPVGPGEAIRVLTGAMVPSDADMVVRVENTASCEDGNSIEVRAIDRRDNIRRPGESIRRGATLISSGTRLHAGHLGLAAGVGNDTLAVRRRPVVAVVSTGDELVPPAAQLPPGAIHETNSVTLAGLVGPDGELATVRHSADDAVALQHELESLASTHDVIVTTGGVSMGAEYDVVRDALARWPVEFWRMALKPAKPMAFGRVRDTLFFGLPGNPVAAIVAFELFVRPALRMLGGVPGATEVESARVRGLAGERLDGGGDAVVRCVAVRRDAEGRWVSAGVQGSAAVMGLAAAEALALIGADVDEVRVGDDISLVPLWNVDPSSLA